MAQTVGNANSSRNETADSISATRALAKQPNPRVEQVRATYFQSSTSCETATRPDRCTVRPHDSGQGSTLPTTRQHNHDSTIHMYGQQRTEMVNEELSEEPPSQSVTRAKARAERIAQAVQPNQQADQHHATYSQTDSETGQTKSPCIQTSPPRAVDYESKHERTLQDSILSRQQLIEQIDLRDRIIFQLKSEIEEKEISSQNDSAAEARSMTGKRIAPAVLSNPQADEHRATCSQTAIDNPLSTQQLIEHTHVRDRVAFQSSRFRRELVASQPLLYDSSTCSYFKFSKTWERIDIHSSN